MLILSLRLNKNLFIRLTCVYYSTFNDDDNEFEHNNDDDDDD
jgi:hypothetical protein